MKCWTKIVALLLSVAAIQGSSQSASEGQGHAQETHGFVNLTWPLLMV